MNFGLFADNVHQACLEGLLVFAQPVLLPSVVEDADVQVVSGHAPFEETQARAVVGLLLELE